MNPGGETTIKPDQQPTKIWVEVTWLVITGLAVWMMFGTMPRFIEAPFVVVLWAMALVAGVMIPLSLLVMMRSSISFDLPPPPRHVYRYAPVWFWRIMPWIIMGSAIVTGRFWLASATFLWWMELSVLRIHQAKLHNQIDYIASYPISSGAYAFVVWCAPPIWRVLSVVPRSIAAAWNRHFERRDAAALRGAFGNPECLIYLIYSEPHQREYFLGETGMLSDFRNHVTERHWDELKAKMWEVPGGEEFYATPEGAMLKRFALSNKHEDLPFIVVADAQDRLTPFFFNNAYRARRRDQGFALGLLEGKLREELEREILQKPRARS